MTIAAALIIGFVLDLLLGDPAWLPHPVVAIGRGIAALEKRLRVIFSATPTGELIAGATLTLIVAALSFFIPLAAVRLAGAVHPLFRLALESVIIFQLLATRSLRDASLKVYRALAAGGLPAAREAVSHIVGRDTANLDASGVARAAVETVAENASDGVVAPMLYFALGGAPLAFLYKAVNTMDSMIGYKNDRHLYFGRAAARLDDIANFVPARLTGLLMTLAARLCGMDWRRSLAVLARDRKNHASPNSAHPEAACAGALGVRLGGDSVYGGRVVAKPGIGDALRPIEPDDILRANRLLYATAALCLAACCLGRAAVLLCLNGA